MEGCFKILKKDKKTDARVGVIQTKKGKIETPFFMPVATKASVKHISSMDLKAMDAKAVISNTLVLHLRPGEALIKKMGGIGKFMNYDGINVTDSGGFQMYSKALYQKSEEKGVHFKNPYDGQTVFITPEKDMKIQLDIDSEIAMCLDTMPLMNHSKEQISLAVERTTTWAKRCKEEHDKLQSKLPKNKRQLLWGITQGGIYPDLREKSARELKEIDFDGYSCGGLALGETLEEEMKMIKIHKKIIGENKPCYLMGAGNPVELLEAISLGVDMFDSRFPTQNARRGTIFTSKGKLRITRKKYTLDKKPLDENCDCFVCKNYTRSYLKYQLMQEEAVGYRLATFHNLYYLQNLMKQARDAIKKGKFKEFKTKIEKVYKKADSDVKLDLPKKKKTKLEKYNESKHKVSNPKE
jgi:queuine tRNA-ribosyltransferase